MELNEKKVVHQFEKASATYQDVAFLQTDIGQRLIRGAGLPFLKNQLESQSAKTLDCSPPARWLDIGCGPATIWSSLEGGFCNQLEFWGLDISYKMLEKAKKHLKGVWVNAHMNQLPLVSRSMDALFSCFALHWSNDVYRALSEGLRVLKPNGKFAFAIPVEQSFSELTDSWRSLDAYPHVHHFPSGAQLFKYLSESPVSIRAWQETQETMYFDSVKQMVVSLRKMGVTNQHPSRHNGLMPKGRWQQFLQAYEDKKTNSGKFPLSYRVLWIYGKKLKK